MKINFLGDSITQGVGANCHEEMYTYLVCQQLGAQECNFGVSGTRFATQTHPTLDNPTFDETFLTRAKKMPADADFTFVFGGTNDFGHGDAPLGQWGDRGEYTFFGAAWQLCEYLLSRFPRERLCFILPTNRLDCDTLEGHPNREHPLRDYVDAIIQTLDHFEMEYLDLRPVIPMEQVMAYTVDGLHPNPAGYRRIADSLCRYLENRRLG